MESCHVGPQTLPSPSSLVPAKSCQSTLTTRSNGKLHCMTAICRESRINTLRNLTFLAEVPTARQQAHLASWGLRGKLILQRSNHNRQGFTRVATRREWRAPNDITGSHSLDPLNDSCSVAFRAEDHNPLETSQPSTSRRSLLSASALFFSSLFLLKHPSKAHAGSIVLSRVPSPETLELLDQASEAWGRGLDPTSPNRWAALAEACMLFDKLVVAEPERLEWREARGQVLFQGLTAKHVRRRQLRVDSKKFNEALTDFNFVLEKNSSNYRGYSSRALAYEGLAFWDKAVEDYTTALRLGKQATGFDEPYVLNSRGNAFASLGKWDEALRDYELSVKGFQAGRQLDGAIYSAANAALMQIQLGNEKEGLKELTTVARRAPGSIDMRAALAALYWSQGREREAESTWEFACENINAGQLYDGCAKYRDQDWLRRIRRWPPVMAERMQDFFQLRHKT